MAETRKKSTTTKTKTTPAKKPTTKPAGKSVAPKQTKTVKAPAKTVTTKKTTTTKATSAKPVAKKKECNICKIIFAIIVAVAVVAAATWAIAYFVNKNSDETVMIENGKGDKVSLKYVSLDDYKYRVLVPTDFKKLSDEDIKADYGSENAPELVYSDADDTVNIAFSAPNNALANDQIKEYLSAMKTILSSGMKVLGSDTYEVDDHTIGVLKLVSDFDGVEVYNQMAFFSYENKLTIITFNCKGEARAEWEKVGDEIIKSINFTK